MQLSEIQPTYHKRERLKHKLVYFIRANIESRKLLEVKKNQLLLTEGGRNTSFYVIVRGAFSLVKSIPTGVDKIVDQVGEGDLVGIISYMTGEEIASSVRADEESWVISLRRAYDILPEKLHEQFNDLVLPVVINSFVDRYRNLIEMHVEMEASRSKLVTQEKMATLGQLVAGVAHELNNPVAALTRSADFAAETIQALIPSVTDKASSWFEAGFKYSGDNTTDQRKRQKALEDRFSHLDRPVLRKVAAWPEYLFDMMGKKPQRSELQSLHQWFELGRALRTIMLTGDRIGAMVKSLKTYSRSSGDRSERVEVNEGLKDTILILGNQLKKRRLRLELNPVSEIMAQSGELNQVWTNIIKNACEATEQDDTILVKSLEEDGLVKVVIEDDGPGIGHEISDKIFEINMTTKHTEGNFGLGLGLPISKQIVEKYGGTVEAKDAEELSGARFEISFQAIRT